jgi:hypothetical protein
MAKAQIRKPDVGKTRLEAAKNVLRREAILVSRREWSPSRPACR